MANNVQNMPYKIFCSFCLSGTTLAADNTTLALMCMFQIIEGIARNAIYMWKWRRRGRRGKQVMVRIWIDFQCMKGVHSNKNISNKCVYHVPLISFEQHFNKIVCIKVFQIRQIIRITHSTTILSLLCLQRSFLMPTQCNKTYENFGTKWIIWFQTNNLTNTNNDHHTSKYIGQKNKIK